MSANHLVRQAVAVDHDQILSLAGDLATSYEAEPAAFRAVFEALLVAPDVLLLVAENDARIVGYLLAQRHYTFRANGPVVWVEELMVAAQHRSAGIGRALMSAVERWGSKEGAAYISLATRRAAIFYTTPLATSRRQPTSSGHYLEGNEFAVCDAVLNLRPRNTQKAGHAEPVGHQRVKRADGRPADARRHRPRRRCCRC